MRSLRSLQLPTLLSTFTHPSSRQTLLDTLHSERPDWVLPLSSQLETQMETEEEVEEGRRASEGEGIVKRVGSGIGIGV